MSWQIIGLILLITFVVMLTLGFPVAIAMMGTSMVIIIAFFPKSAISQVVSIISRQGTNFSLLTIPLFMLMAAIINVSGITSDLFSMMKKWFGHLPGGLGMASVAACAAFGAVTGSSIATTVAIGSIAIPEMRKAGYDGVFATAIIASAGPLGTLIPPSNTGILYGVITETSIGKIFMASVLPGLLLTAMFMLYIYIYSWLKPNMAPKVAKTSWGEKIKSLKSVIGILILMVLVLGFIYLGVCTPSEAAALGCIGAMILALIKKRVSWSVLKEILLNISTSTSTIMLLLIGTFLIGYVMIYGKIATNVTETILSISQNKWIILTGTYILFIVLGMLIDAMAIVCLAIPLLMPILLSVGFDPIWFGVIVIVLSMIGFISPPVGLAMYIAHGYAEDVPLGKVMIGVIPFILVMLIFLAVITIFPNIIMWIPNRMAV